MGDSTVLLHSLAVGLLQSVSGMMRDPAGWLTSHSNSAKVASRCNGRVQRAPNRGGFRHGLRGRLHLGTAGTFDLGNLGTWQGSYETLQPFEASCKGLRCRRARGLCRGKSVVLVHSCHEGRHKRESSFAPGQAAEAD